MALSGPAAQTCEGTSVNTDDVAVSSDVHASVRGAARVSYASPTRTNVRNDDVSATDPENHLSGRGLTVLFHPRCFVASGDVFTALSEAGLDSTAVSCVQRQSSGAIVLTFRRMDL